MASTYNCSNCGKVGYPSGGQSYDQTPSGWVWNKSFGFGRKLFCSNRCLDEYNVRNSPKSEGATKNESNEEKSTEKKSGGFLSGLMGNNQDSAAKLEKAKLTTTLFSDILNENKNIREKVDAVSKMTFANDANELANQMNELLTIGAGTSSDHKELIKACYEKMDFGVMKLKSLGATAEADFFAEKRKSIKPKGFFGF